MIEFNTILGRLEIRSPYLWSKGNRFKPLKDEMGITHQGRSEAVNRALSDFGSEESFVQAAERFKEHYKYDLGPTAVCRVTTQVAEQAQRYIEDKLFDAGEKYGDRQEVENVEKMLIELDGCDIRTAQLIPIEGSIETSPILELPKKQKVINWREVRIGLARPLGSVAKTYIGKMDSYPEVVRQLFNASVIAGMSVQTQVVGVADGGNGLREELESQFENMVFILDKTHLKDHLYETAEELAISKQQRPSWVTQRLEAISNGQVEKVRDEFEQQYSQCPNQRLKRLIGYINRFKDALNYSEFKEKGYPIGSGEIESAHKSIPQKRMKLPGACWHPGSVNPMLALRILRANDWWNDLWKERAENKIAA